MENGSGDANGGDGQAGHGDEFDSGNFNQPDMGANGRRGHDAQDPLEPPIGGHDVHSTENGAPDGAPKPPASENEERPREQPSRSSSRNQRGKRHPTRTMRKSSDRAGSDARRQTPIFQAHTLSHFFSTSRIPRTLEALVAKSLEKNTRLDHILIHGAAGSGTALLARALIGDYAPNNVVEIDGALGCDPDVLMRGIDEVGPRGVLFIRHVDAFDATCDQILTEAIAGRAVRGRRNRRFGPVDPTESELDRVIAESAGADSPPTVRGNAPRDFTVVATAHVMPAVGYLLRTRFEQMFNLRDDPKALRNAVIRSARRGGSVTIDATAFPQLERVLKTLCDAAEPVVRAILMRAELDGLGVIDEAAMRSILEEDLAARLPDEAYASSLRRHLAGRRVEVATPEEIARIAAETGWGVVAAEGAISVMIREDMRRRVA